jgi:hypothetical protein
MDAIDAQAVTGVSFIHRIVFDAAIDKSRTSKEQFRPGILNPVGLYHLEVPLAIDIQVKEGLDIAVHITYLAGQTENKIVLRHHLAHQVQGLVCDGATDHPRTASDQDLGSVKRP